MDELPAECLLPQPPSQARRTGGYFGSEYDADAYDRKINATPGIQNASRCPSEEQVSPQASFPEVHSIETSEGDDDVADAEVTESFALPSRSMENGFAHIGPSSGPIRTKPTFRAHRAHSPTTRLHSSIKDPQGPLDEDLISRVSQILLNNNTQASDDVYCFCAACGQKFKGNYRHVVERHRHSKRCQVVQDQNVEEKRGPQLTEDFIVAAFQAALKGTSLNIY
ncbi:hypothetical protein ONZ45_g3361 [Pleurotus djamor]|nr:hypothetical protein ONZ45_g3361 [Pleurotus djamor]